MDKANNKNRNTSKKPLTVVSAVSIASVTGIVLGIIIVVLGVIGLIVSRPVGMIFPVVLTRQLPYLCAGGALFVRCFRKPILIGDVVAAPIGGTLAGMGADLAVRTFLVATRIDVPKEALLVPILVCTLGLITGLLILYFSFKRTFTKKALAH